MIVGLIFFAVWAVTIWLHWVVCKKRVWLEYDFGQREWGYNRTPIRQDLINEQHSKGGPLIILPFLGTCILVATWLVYVERKCLYNERYRNDELLENKPLKR